MRRGVCACCNVFVLCLHVVMIGEFLICDAYALNIALFMAVCADSACGANFHVRHGLRWGCCVVVSFFLVWGWISNSLSVMHIRTQHRSVCVDVCMWGKHLCAAWIPLGLSCKCVFFFWILGE